VIEEVIVAGQSVDCSCSGDNNNKNNNDEIVDSNCLMSRWMKQ
jgi:hypothetical protein